MRLDQVSRLCSSKGGRTIIVERANCFARYLIVIAADSPGAFVDDTPTTTVVRQVLGAVAQLDKAMTVAKLRGARDRKRRQTGWCEGGAPLHERYPEDVRMAKRLHRAIPVTGKRRSLRKIAGRARARRPPY